MDRSPSYECDAFTGLGGAWSSPRGRAPALPTSIGRGRRRGFWRAGHDPVKVMGTKKRTGRERWPSTELGYVKIPRLFAVGKKIDDGAFRVFVVLCERRDFNTNTAVVGAPAIARRCGCSVRTAQRRIEKLILWGWVEKASRGHGRANKYVLHEQSNVRFPSDRYDTDDRRSTMYTSSPRQPDKADAEAGLANRSCATSKSDDVGVVPHAEPGPASPMPHGAATPATPTCDTGDAISNIRQDEEQQHPEPEADAAAVASRPEPEPEPDTESASSRYSATGTENRERCSAGNRSGAPPPSGGPADSGDGSDSGRPDFEAMVAELARKTALKHLTTRFRIGVDGTVAKKMVEAHPAAYICAWCKAVEYRTAHGERPLRNPAGFLRRMIETRQSVPIDDYTDFPEYGQWVMARVIDLAEEDYREAIRDHATDKERAREEQVRDEIAAAISDRTEIEEQDARAWVAKMRDAWIRADALKAFAISNYPILSARTLDSRFWKFIARSDLPAGERLPEVERVRDRYSQQEAKPSQED